MTPEVAPGHYLVKYEGFAPHRALQVAQRSLVQQFRVTNGFGGLFVKISRGIRRAPATTPQEAVHSRSYAQGRRCPKSRETSLGIRKQGGGGERGGAAALLRGGRGAADVRNPRDSKNYHRPGVAGVES